MDGLQLAQLCIVDPTPLNGNGDSSLILMLKACVSATEGPESSFCNHCEGFHREKLWNS